MKVLSIFMFSFFYFLSIKLDAKILESYKLLPKDFGHGIPPRSSYLGFQFQVIWIEGSHWTFKNIQREVRIVAKIYRQCDLYLKSVSILKLRTPNKRIHWEKHRSKGKKSVVFLRTQAPSSDKNIQIFLTGPFLDAPKSAGFSNTKWKMALEKRPLLRDSIFLSDYFLTDDYQQRRKSSPYSLMAHELLHILTRKISHTKILPKNLRNLWRERSNLLLKDQCDSIYNGPHIEKYSNYILSSK